MNVYSFKMLLVCHKYVYLHKQLFKRFSMYFIELILWTILNLLYEYDYDNFNYFTIKTIVTKHINTS